MHQSSPSAKTSPPIHTAQPGNRRPISLMLAICLAIAVVLVFLPVKDNALLTYDDFGNVLTNPYFHPLTVRNVAQLWRVPYFGTFAPVTYSFFALEVYFAEKPVADASTPPLDARLLHLGNLALHVLGVCLVFVLLHQLTGHRAASACAALVFGLHPCQAEPVAWVTETKTLLAGLFALLALSEYLRFAQQRSAPAATRGRSRSRDRRMAAVHYLIALLAFVLAILAKAQAVAIPLMALALDILWLRRPLRQSLIGLSPWFAAAAILAYVTKQQQYDTSLEYVAPFWTRPFIAGDAVAFYLLKLIAPIRLSADYGRSPRFVLAHWWGYATWLLPALGITVVALLQLDRRYWAALAVSAAALLPVSGLIPFGFQDISTVTDRYLHLCLFGVALAVAWFLTTHPRRAYFAAVLGVVCTFGVLSWRQVHQWRNDRVLAEAGLRISPHSELLTHLLGGYFLLHRQDAEALKYFRLAAAEHPDSVRSQLRLAKVLDDFKQPQEAMLHYNQAIALQPERPEVQRALAAALARRGQFEQALVHYSAALRNDPTPRLVYLDMADAYSKLNRLGQAIDCYHHALRFHHEDFGSWMALGRTLQKAGNFQEAANAYGEAARIDPHDALSRLQAGTVLAQLGDRSRAIAAVREAIRIDPDLPVAHQNLAAALAADGNTAEAILHLRAALRLAPEDPDANYSLGVLLVRESKWPEAIDRLRLAISKRPDWIEPRSILAEVMEKTDRPDEAVQIYQDALKIGPNRAEIHRGLGFILARQGQKQQAIEHLSLAVALDPTDQRARDALRTLGITQSAGPSLPATTTPEG